MKSFYTYLSFTLFVLFSLFTINSTLAQSQKRLNKADVLIRSDKDFSFSDNKYYFVSDTTSFVFNEDEILFRDSLLSRFFLGYGAKIVNKQEDADYIIYCSYKVKHWTNSIVDVNKNKIMTLVDDDKSNKPHSDLFYLENDKRGAALVSNYPKNSIVKNRSYSFFTSKDDRYRYDYIFDIRDNKTNDSSYLYHFQCVILQSKPCLFKDVLSIMLSASSDYFGDNIGKTFKHVKIRKKNGR